MLIKGKEIAVFMSISMDEKIDKLGLNLKQILALVLTFIVAMVLTIFGWTYNCFGLFLIGVGLYMIPHLVKVESVKLLSVYGLVFIVVAIVIGAAFMAPGVVSANDEPPENDDYFTDIVYTYEDGQVTVTADLAGEPTGDVIVRTWNVVGIGFTQFNGSLNGDFLATVTETSGSYSMTVTFDANSSQLYLASIAMYNSFDEETRSIDSGDYTNSWLLVDAYSGDYIMLYLTGVFMAVIYTMIIFYMVLFLSAFMRARLEKTRAKMEAEGRLYPQGYGRCEKCGAVVLPGEVNCRKCGAYIDRPDEMKPHKADFFTCSECGAEVPADAKTCPKCGATFDDDVETEVVHADGSIDVTTETMLCPDCHEEIPAAAKFCPKCGKKFDGKE